MRPSLWAAAKELAARSSRAARSIPYDESCQFVGFSQAQGATQSHSVSQTVSQSVSQFPSLHSVGHTTTNLLYLTNFLQSLHLPCGHSTCCSLSSLSHSLALTFCSHLQIQIQIRIRTYAFTVALSFSPVNSNKYQAPRLSQRHLISIKMIQDDDSSALGQA